MVPNAHPLRGLRKDGLLATLEATFGGGTWTVDTAETDFPFWSTTVTDVGAGVWVFNFQPIGANKKGRVFVSLEEPADDPANTVGHDVKTRLLNLSAGTVRVTCSTYAADPALADPSDNSRLTLEIYAETL